MPDSTTRRRFLTLSAGAATALATASTARLSRAAKVTFKMDDLARFGATIDPSAFARLPQILDPELLRDFPSQHAMNVSLKNVTTRHIVKHLPPVSEQGTPSSLGFPGTCEAQGFGYGLGTATIARYIDGSERLDPDLPSSQPSAAWLFASETERENPASPSCGGSQATPYMNMLVLSGSPSTEDVPYKPVCAYLAYRSSSNPGGIDTNLASYPHASKLRIGSYVAIGDLMNNRNKYLSTLKAYLRAGHVFAFTGLVAKGYDTPLDHMTRGAFDPAGFIKNSGHSQVLVGYDDSLGTSGAFLVQNSFGTGWPGPGRSKLEQGRLWWTYEAFFRSQAYGAIAYSLHSKKPPTFFELKPATGSAPFAGIVTGIRPKYSGGTYKLVLELYFEKPGTLSTIELSHGERPAGSATYNAPIGSGYVAFESSGPFPAGPYHAVASITIDGAAITYEGNVTVT